MLNTQTLNIRPYLRFTSESQTDAEVNTKLKELGKELVSDDEFLREPKLTDSYRALSSIIRTDPGELSQIKDMVQSPGLSPEKLQAWTDKMVVQAFISEPGLAGAMGSLVTSYTTGQDISGVADGAFSFRPWMDDSTPPKDSDKFLDVLERNAGNLASIKVSGGEEQQQVDHARSLLSVLKLDEGDVKDWDAHLDRSGATPLISDGLLANFVTSSLKADPLVYPALQDARGQDWIEQTESGLQG